MRAHRYARHTPAQPLAHGAPCTTLCSAPAATPTPPSANTRHPPSFTFQSTTPIIEYVRSFPSPPPRKHREGYTMHGHRHLLSLLQLAAWPSLLLLSGVYFPFFPAVLNFSSHNAIPTSAGVALLTCIASPLKEQNQTSWSIMRRIRICRSAGILCCIDYYWIQCAGGWGPGQSRLLVQATAAMSLQINCMTKCY